MKTGILSISLVSLTLIALVSCAIGKPKPEPFVIDKNSPKIDIGEIETQYQESLSFTGLKKYSLAVSYYPAEDAVCLQYKNGFTVYNQFWSRDGREAFAAALAKYNEDFEAKNLPNRSARRMNRTYGTIQGYLVWQTFSFSTLCRANMDVELGYDFYQRTPYFTVNQRKTEFIDPMSPQDVFTAENVTFHFTRAQAEEVVKIFDQQSLDGLILNSGGRFAPSNPSVDADAY